MNRLKKLTHTDYIAIPVLGAVIVYMLFFVFRGISVIDESFYLTIAHRLSQGDRLIVDDWHVSQLSVVFQYLPFLIFRKITGSTDGCILFFRIFYVLLHSAVSVFIYFKTRKYGSISILSAILFCHYTLIVPAVNYYTVSIMAVVIIAFLFIIPDSTSTPYMLLTGICIACLVLSEPLMAVIYFVWMIFVAFSFFRKKDTLCQNDLKTALTVTAGIAAVAAAFFIWMFSKESISEFIKAVPNMFTDSEYVFTFGNAQTGNVFGFSALISVLKNIGIHFFIVYIIILAAVIIDKNRKSRLTVYVPVCCALFIWQFISVLFTANTDNFLFVFYRNIPVAMFSLLCFCLLEKKDKKLFAFWLFGLIYSFIIDVSSERTVMIGAVISDIPGCIFIYQLYDELRQSAKQLEQIKRKSEKRKKEIKVLTALSVTVLISTGIIFAGEASSFITENRCLIFENYYTSDKSAVSSTKLERGPLSGIYTSEKSAVTYGKILDDLDVIKSSTDSPVYIYGRLSWAYLYLDKPYAAYSSWYVEQDSRTRQMTYYELHPEKIPGYIYIPEVTDIGFSDCSNLTGERIQYLESIFDCSFVKGEAGYIVRINSAKF